MTSNENPYRIMLIFKVLITYVSLTVNSHSDSDVYMLQALFHRRRLYPRLDWNCFALVRSLIFKGMGWLSKVSRPFVYVDLVIFISFIELFFKLLQLRFLQDGINRFFFFHIFAMKHQLCHTKQRMTSINHHVMCLAKEGFNTGSPINTPRLHNMHRRRWQV